MDLDHLVNSLEVQQLDTLLHELNPPANEALDVTKDRLHVGNGAVEVVDDRSTFFIFTSDVTEFAKDVLREFFFHELVHFELIAPTEGSDKHGVSIFDVQVST